MVSDKGVSRFELLLSELNFHSSPNRMVGKLLNNYLSEQMYITHKWNLSTNDRISINWQFSFKIALLAPTISQFVKVTSPLTLIRSRDMWTPILMTQMSHVYVIIWLNCTLAHQLTQTSVFEPPTPTWSGSKSLGMSLSQKGANVGGQNGYFKSCETKIAKLLHIRWIQATG